VDHRRSSATTAKPIAPRNDVPRAYLNANKKASGANIKANPPPNGPDESASTLNSPSPIPREVSDHGREGAHDAAAFGAEN